MPFLKKLLVTAAAARSRDVKDVIKYLSRTIGFPRTLGGSHLFIYEKARMRIG